MIRTYAYEEARKLGIMSRSEAVKDVSGPVRQILENVRKNGDQALREYTERFDHVRLERFEVTPQEMEEGCALVDEKFYAILEEAAANIESFHRHQTRNGFIVTKEDGVVLGQIVTPIERVGFYVPGGTASYPSSMLMNCIPARIAGCKVLEVVTPPGPDGKVNPVILAAARIAGVDKIYKVGGAQAVAALAFGTQSIPRVCKIVGPGNAYVAEAKKQVFGKVGINTVAGPSEVLILADKDNDPAVVASDLIAQAEHDRMASTVLVTDSEKLAEEVTKELEKQLSVLPRQEIARTSIDTNGKIVLVPSLQEGIECANEIAPEHLEILVQEPFSILSQLKNAGSIFVGPYAPVALGDYMAGPNHTLPTMGTAWFESPLSVDDFIKKSQFTYYSKEALQKASVDIEDFAHREGLDGHAQSIRARFHDQAFEGKASEAEA